MADRGFEIQDLLAPRKVYLNIPPFMRSKDQLNSDEEDETREIASVRIHVERAIERVKNCNILKQILPILPKILPKSGKSAVYWPILRDH